MLFLTTFLRSQGHGNVEPLIVQEAEMTTDFRAEIVAQITELRKQVEPATQALSGSLTREQEAERQERADRLACLVLELETFDELTGRRALGSAGTV